MATLVNLFRSGGKPVPPERFMPGEAGKNGKARRSKPRRLR